MFWSSSTTMPTSTLSLTDAQVNLTAWGGLFQAILRLAGERDKAGEATRRVPRSPRCQAQLAALFGSFASIVEAFCLYHCA